MWGEDDGGGSEEDLKHKTKCEWKKACQKCV